MSIRPEERISFVLSSLSREQQQTRRRTPADDFATRSAAAVAGACSDIESAANDDDASKNTHVDAKRSTPPKLKPRRLCCTVLVAMWTLLTISVSCMTLLNMTNGRFFDADDPAVERRIARDSSIKDRVEFGIWDSKRSVTPMQLQVSVSMALGVRAEDDDINIKIEDNSFFEITVQHATHEESDYISTETFIDKLNGQLSYYGGLGVLSKPPRLLKNHSA